MNRAEVRMNYSLTLDEDGSIDVSELYEANDNGYGVLVATNGTFTKKDKNAWKRLPG